MSVDLEFDYNEATATLDKFSQKDIEELQTWTQKLDKSKLVPKDLSDKQLLLFHNACYGHMDKTKQCIENFYRCRENAPKIFNDRRFTNKDLQQASEVCEFIFLPEKSCEGYDVLFTRLHNCDHTKYDLDAICKLMFMAVDQRLRQLGPISGSMLLFDMGGMTFGHFTRIHLSTIRRVFPYIQRALQVRMKAIHVVNTEPILDKMMFLIRPFMDKQFYDLIKFHNKKEDPEVLYKVVAKSNLPPEYGGSLPDSQKMHKDLMKELQLLEPYFDAEEEQRIKAYPDKTEEKIECTFGKLDID